MLTDAQQDLLDMLRAEDAPVPFRADPHWQDVSRMFSEHFETEGIGNIQEQYYNSRFAGYDPKSRLYRHLSNVHRDYILNRDFLELSRGDSSPETLLSVDDFYNILSLKPELIKEHLIVADIGGGWGRMGYILMRANPTITYLDFDIPETLLVAISYLPTRLPDARFMCYPETKKHRLNRDVLRSNELWLMPAQDLLRVEDDTLDLAINLFSFQEMEKESVNLYLYLIDRKLRIGGAVYLREYGHGKSLGLSRGEIGDIGDYEFPKTWHEIFLRDVLFAEDFFEAGFIKEGG